MDRTDSKIDTRLAQAGSLDVLWRHLIRLRPRYSPEKRALISNLAKQCENYEPGNRYLARRMLETIERIRPAPAPNAEERQEGSCLK